MEEKEVMGMFAMGAEFDPKRYATDLSKLHEMLDKAGIKHIYRVHPGAELEPQVLDLIGYFPAGTHQIIVPDVDWKLSIIRGMVSWGFYEVYDGENCTRFDTPRKVVNFIKKGKYEKTKA